MESRQPLRHRIGGGRDFGLARGAITGPMQCWVMISAAMRLPLGWSVTRGDKMALAHEIGGGVQGFVDADEGDVASAGAGASYAAPVGRRRWQIDSAARRLPSLAWSTNHHARRADGASRSCSVSRQPTTQRPVMISPRRRTDSGSSAKTVRASAWVISLAISDTTHARTCTSTVALSAPRNRGGAMRTRSR